VRELLETVREWEVEGIGFGRAVLVNAFGSSPRQPGATLLVGDDGRMAGSVSGGCVEGAAFTEVGRARRDGLARLIRYGISDETAWDVGLACGGTIDVLIEPTIRPEVMEAAQLTATDRRPRAVIVGLPEVDGSNPPGEALRSYGDVPLPAELARAVDAAIAEESSAVLDVGGENLFVEVFVPAPRLVIVGAVHVAAPLVDYARTLGYHTVVIDRRETFVAGQRLAADQTVIDWPEDAAEAIGLGPDDAVAILSHDPKLDEPAIIEALRRGCRYVGAIGSRKTQADRRQRLLAAGLTSDQLDRLHGPIGLDLGGRDPAEVALAIIAQVIAERHSGSARPMSTVASVGG
jgi:xanthine dehydrogenase accessory factor